MQKIELKKIVKQFQVKKKYEQTTTTVLNGVSFKIQKGENVALLGPSGSGKTTLARILLGLETINQGEIFVNGQLVGKKIPRKHLNCSIVFQNYRSSINPYYSVQEALQEVSKKETTQQDYLNLLQQVGLAPAFLERNCQTLSGGEIQRVCVARAIASQADFLIFDEAFNALDLVQSAQLLELLKELKQVKNFTYLVITHDLKLACSLCDRLVFLKEGRVVEDLPTKQLKTTQSMYVKRLFEEYGAS